MAIYALDADLALDGPPQGAWTVADWERLPDTHDGRRYELLNGVVYMTASPSFFHQWIINRLITLLGVPAQAQGLGIWAVGPVGLTLAPQDAVQHFCLQAAGSYSPPQTHTAPAAVACACLPTLPLSVADLFADAPDTTL